MNFDKITGVVADMDGVLWLGDQPLKGLHPFFALVQQNDIPFALATNNSSKSPADYVGKLTKMGVANVPQTNIVNSGIATATVLRDAYPAGAYVHVFGGAGLHRVMDDAGFTLVEDLDTTADVVVVGLDFELTYEKLRVAALHINRGADFWATNDDPSYPSPEGLVPGAGSVVNLFITATGKTPTVVGKPHAPMFEAALKILGTDPANTLMIGDRLNTDIQGAQGVGMQTVLLLSGVTKADDLATSDIQPDVAYEDLDALVKAWNYTGGKRLR